jgi:hypothetical protein
MIEVSEKNPMTAKDQFPAQPSLKTRMTAYAVYGIATPNRFSAAKNTWF